jgi:hypothetical protein
MPDGRSNIMQHWIKGIAGAKWGVVWGLLVAAALWSGRGEVAAQGNWTVPPVAPVLNNPGFECGIDCRSERNPASRDSLVPAGWSIRYLQGSPDIWSTRKYVESRGGGWVERLDGDDSLFVRSEDIESTDKPGKPFDVVIYQRVPVTRYGSYTLTGWIWSICGTQDKTARFDCPDGHYIAKSIGIDPSGGTDPTAPSVIWSAENRKNSFRPDWTPEGIQKFGVGAMALEPALTVFVRVTSPFQFHGNLAFVDAFMLVRSPLAVFVNLPARVTGSRTTLTWDGHQSPDIAALANRNYQLWFDVQVRHGTKGEWRAVAGDQQARSAEFQARCLNTTYQFRVRAVARQPDRSSEIFPGAWSVPRPVYFARLAQPAGAAGEDKMFLPVVLQDGGC